MFTKKIEQYLSKNDPPTSPSHIWSHIFHLWLRLMHHGWPRQARPLAHGAPRLTGILWLFDVNFVIPLWLFLSPPSTHRNWCFPHSSYHNFSTCTHFGWHLEGVGWFIMANRKRLRRLFSWMSDCSCHQKLSVSLESAEQNLVASPTERVSAVLQPVGQRRFQGFDKLPVKAGPSAP